MKIVHALWEQRNMGVDTWEVEIESGDSFDEFDCKRGDFESDYTVVRVPTYMNEWGFYLQDKGYSYVETLFSVSKDVRMLPEMSGIQARIIEKTSYAKMEESDMLELFDKIKQGLFSTDRVVVDNYFSKEQAHNRYIGWINDEIANGGNLFKIVYKDSAVGFFTLKDKGDGIYHSALGAVYQENNIAGMGTAMEYLEQKAVNEMGGRKLLAGVSTNNGKSLALPFTFGFSIDKINAVYIKHSK